MMQEKVITAQVKINSAGQTRHFQLRLPKDTKTIIGVEHGVRIISWAGYNGGGDASGEAASGNGGSFLSFNRSLLMGELKLQSCEEANIFYSAHVQTDENLDQGDFSKYLDTNWVPSPYTHQGKTEEEVIVVKGVSTIINGVYKDRIGEQHGINAEYILNVYLWVKIDSEKEKGEDK